MTTATAREAAGKERTGFGASVPFDAIGEPGAYVCNWNGHLLRIAGSGLGSARRPPLNLVALEPLMVTKISANPYVAVRLARSLAQRLPLEINF